MKSIKKLLAVILALAFVMGLGTVGVQAATDLFKTLGTEILDFEDFTLVDYSTSDQYLQDKEGNNTAVVVNNRTTQNLFVVDKDKDGNSLLDGNALMFDSNHAVNKSNVRFFSGNAAVNDNIKVEFSAKFVNTSTLPFYFYYRSSSTLQLLKWHYNMVTVAGQDTAAYDNDTWYDIKFVINPENYYIRYSMKKHNETEWENYDVFYGDNSSYNKINSASLLYLGFEGSSASDAQLYMDNFKLSKAIDDEASPTLSTYNDDFEGTGSYIYPLEDVKDYRSEWYKENYDSHTTVTNEPLENVTGKVLTVNTTTTSTVYPSISKCVEFKNASGLLHHFKFKMGGTNDGGIKKFILRVGTTGNQNAELLRMARTNAKFTVSLFGEATAATVSENKLYDCEVIFDDKTNNAIISFTDDNGKRFTKTALIQSDTSLYLTRVCFSNQTGVASKMYVDDFTWDIYEANQLTFNGAALKSGAADSANLDDEVSFIYQGASIKHDATVAVTKGGTAVDASEYTVTANNNVYTVSFNELEKGGVYTVTLSGVKSLYDEAIEDKSITFTAASTGVTATAPAVAGNTASTTVTSYYSKGKNVWLLVALYDANGKITEVVTTEALADARDGETVSIDLSGKTYATAKAFIWNLATLVPIEIAQ